MTAAAEPAGPRLTVSTGGLPLLVSVPHGGLLVPKAARAFCGLSADEIIADGDVGALEIYGGLEGHAAAFVATDVARAIIDINRAEDDWRKDGVVKTHTCWDVPVYGRTPPDSVFEQLIEDYHRPYHAHLTTAAARDDVRFAVDCHTMAAFGPPVGPDPGVERPLLCLGNARGETCSNDLLAAFAKALEDAFEHPVSLNEPFSGGYDVRAHHHEVPWVQLEMSRTDALSNDQKAAAVRRALESFCADAL